MIKKLLLASFVAGCGIAGVGVGFERITAPESRLTSTDLGGQGMTMCGQQPSMEDAPRVAEGVAPRVRSVPTEKDKTTLPTYVIEPPDILLIDGQQGIAGEHLVSPDGTVNLGIYGTVYVYKMTLDEAQAKIIERLKEYLDDPVVAVDLLACNSKAFYIITEVAGEGSSIVRVPATGNETVLDAIAQVNGLSRLSSKNIWIARPAPGVDGCDQILPVNWKDIAKGGATATNYHVLPGDRVFIVEDRFDTIMQESVQPFQLVFRIGSLTISDIQTMIRYPNADAGVP